MKVTSSKNNQDGTHVIVNLLAQHQAFHQYLDKLAASSNDIKVINLLIEIRRFNMDSISKYTGLVAKKHFAGPKASFHLNTALNLLKADEMTLWNIHNQLSRLVPLYKNALKHKKLSQVYRMIVSNIYDQLIAAKEELLHPVSEIEVA